MVFFSFWVISFLTAISSTLFMHARCSWPEAYFKISSFGITLILNGQIPGKLTISGIQPCPPAGGLHNETATI